MARRGWSKSRAGRWSTRQGIVLDLALAVALLTLVGVPSLTMLWHGDLQGPWAAGLSAVVIAMHLTVAVRELAPLPSYGVIVALSAVLLIAPAMRGETGQSLGNPVPAIMLPSILCFSVALFTAAERLAAPWAQVTLGVAVVGAVLTAGRVWGSPGWESSPLHGAGWRAMFALALAAAAVLPWVAGRYRAAGAAHQHQVATTAERQRIAREMHDVLAHSLAVIVGQAEGGRLVAGRDPERAAVALGTIASTAREALTDVRGLLGRLDAESPDGDPARTPQPGLADVPELLDSIGAAGVVVTSEVSGDPALLTPAAQLTVYRLVQESLTNVVKHASSARAEVSIDIGRVETRVSVADDGGGRVVSNAPTPGRGLSGMSDRVGVLGGQLHYGPQPDGSGFGVTATFPTRSSR